jgi:hypothetical protein
VALAHVFALLELVVLAGLSGGGDRREAVAGGDGGEDGRGRAEQHEDDDEKGEGAHAPILHLDALEHTFDTGTVGSAERAVSRTGVARELGRVAARAAPVSLSAAQVLPVLSPLEGLLPEGGLRRGSVVGVTGPAGATSLALALVAGASVTGSWCAVVGVPSLGVAAAAELGLALERLALVPFPAAQWATVTAALLDALDVVVVRPARPVRPADARRLAARARERGSVLVPLAAGPPAWPEGLDLRLRAVGATWHGLGSGHGHLRARRVEVVASGRGAAARERRVALWLPGPGGVQPGAPAARDQPAVV